MLSVKFSRFGKPEEVLEVQEVETPSPKAGEVLVKMTARPINPSDLLTVAGLYGRLPKLPATAGYEGAGVVEKLGEGVTGLQVGQRVIPLGVVGTWQEYIIASPLQLLPTPDSLSDALAAQFVVN
ncbi:MAG: alcohol dehydrogenase catalytic domain-containing protein, partial [Blastocatellia bacterium]|nr:alcohol dehydrogenase catalytic domain-containing protein [Blastocatellia bacterium]